MTHDKLEFKFHLFSTGVWTYGSIKQFLRASVYLVQKNHPFIKLLSDSNELKIWTLQFTVSYGRICCFLKIKAFQNHVDQRLAVSNILISNVKPYILYNFYSVFCHSNIFIKYIPTTVFMQSIFYNILTYFLIHLPTKQCTLSL